MMKMAAYARLSVSLSLSGYAWAVLTETLGPRAKVLTSIFRCIVELASSWPPAIGREHGAKLNPRAV